MNRVAALTFGIGVAVTAAGGMVFGATSGGFNPNSGYDLISRLLAIIILGGLGSIGGALAAAVFMITLESLVDVLVPELADRGVLRRAGARADVPPVGAVRPEGGAGAMTPSALRAAVRPAGARTGRRALLAAGGLAVLLAVVRRLPAGVQQPARHHVRVRHADLHRGARSPGTSSPGTPATSRSGHAVFFGTGMYTVALCAQHWNLAGDAVFALLPLAAVWRPRSSRCRSGWSRCGSGGTRSW